MRVFVLMIALAVCGFAQDGETYRIARRAAGIQTISAPTVKKSAAKRRKPVAKKRTAVKTESGGTFGGLTIGSNSVIAWGTDGAGTGLSPVRPTYTYTPDTCTVFVLLSALEEANREFVTDPNESDHAQWSTWTTAIGTLTWTNPDYRTQADKLRADAEIKAKELERKSEIAKRIRAAIAACNGVPDTVLHRSAAKVIDLRKPQ